MFGVPLLGGSSGHQDWQGGHQHHPPLLEYRVPHRQWRNNPKADLPNRFPEVDQRVAELWVHPQPPVELP